ncbi:MAG: hypothetical protein M3O24_02625 [Thermoproteota archaeon]|nr:hypothetical protein [Thermoproteota archaeon]
MNTGTDRISLVIDGLIPYYDRAIRKTGSTNANTIVDFLQALKVEINASENYKKSYIVTLTKLSTFHNNKSFKEMTRDDLLSFLDSFRKLEAVDPLHKWIGTFVLQNNLDGDNRIKAIELRDGLLSYITGFFSDYR